MPIRISGHSAVDQAATVSIAPISTGRCDAAHKNPLFIARDALLPAAKIRLT
jgi:hypothetical protein